MLVDQAGELIADIMTANRSLSAISSASAILDTSNYTFQAITYGKDADGFKNHAHIILNTVINTVPSNKNMVLFGGSTSSFVFKNNTWQTSSLAFSASYPTSSPPARYGHGMAYDSNRGKVVMFGGWSGSLPYAGDTWEFSGNHSGVNWVKVSTSGPTPAESPALVFDKYNNKVLVFGGQITARPNETYSNDMWGWNGTSWTQVSQTIRPPARAGHCMVYDEYRDRIVMFGGYNLSYLNDTWEWNPITGSWSKIIPTGSSPSPRGYYGMVYDVTNKVTILYGGLAGNGNRSDVWKWDGTTWTDITPQGAGSPGARYGHSMAYHKDRNVTVVFGGLDRNLKVPNDTWEFYNTANSFWIQRSASGPAGLYLAAMSYFDDKATKQIFDSNDGIIKVLSYEAVSVSSYHTSATASALQNTYKLLPQSPSPLDTRLELKSTLPNYTSGVPDIGHCLNAQIDTNLKSYAHLIGCFPAASGTKFWMVSSAINPSASIIISGTLSSLYNTLNLMDASGYLTFAPGRASDHNSIWTLGSYPTGAIRAIKLNFPQQINIAWNLPYGDAGALLLFGGIYQLGLWYLDLKEMLKQGYYPPYNFNSLNNIRKYKLFAKKTFNKDLLYLNDAFGLSGFKTYFADSPTSLITYNWNLNFY